MIKELTAVIRGEWEALNKLLSLLDEQHKYVMQKKVFELEALVDKMKLVNKEIAEREVERRRLVGKESMKDIIVRYNDEELDKAYRDVNKLLQIIQSQKDTNELLIKQQMSFNNQILNIINPRREMKTYNSYGNLSR